MFFLTKTLGIQGENRALAIQDRLRYHDVYSDDGEDDNFDNSLAVTSREPPSHEILNDLSAGDFILVKFSSNKNNISFYIGQVSKLYDDGEYEVKFLRKTAVGKFVFPHAEDVASVNVKDIMQVLTSFEVHRDMYSFRGLTITPYVK